MIHSYDGCLNSKITPFNSLYNAVININRGYTDHRSKFQERCNDTEFLYENLHNFTTVAHSIINTL